MFETTNQGALYAGLVMEVPHWMFFLDGKSQSKVDGLGIPPF